MHKDDSKMMLGRLFAFGKSSKRQRACCRSSKSPQRSALRPPGRISTSASVSCVACCSRCTQPVSRSTEQIRISSSSELSSSRSRSARLWLKSPWPRRRLKRGLKLTDSGPKTGLNRQLSTSNRPPRRTSQRSHGPRVPLRLRSGV